MLKKMKPNASTSDPKEKIDTVILYSHPNNVRRHSNLVRLSEALAGFLRNNTGPAKGRVKK